MRRFFVDRQLSSGGRITLDGDEARHILSVLRMRAGDELILINGSGFECRALIERANRTSAELLLLASQPSSAEPSTRVTLLQGFPKAGKLETIIQKCVELGIHDIQPVLMHRSVSRPERNDAKQSRYSRISAEAAKQCGRAVVPAVHPVRALKSCDFAPFELVLIAYEGEERLSLKSALTHFKELGAPSPRIALIIGPEGGLEESEVEFILAASKNAVTVSLGQRILRTETAGMAALAMLLYELEG